MSGFPFPNSRSRPVPDEAAPSIASSGTTQTIDTRQAHALRSQNPALLNEFHHAMLHKFDRKMKQQQQLQQHGPSARAPAAASTALTSLTSAGALPSVLTADRLSRLTPAARKQCLDLMRSKDCDAGWVGDFLGQLREQGGNNNNDDDNKNNKKNKNNNNAGGARESSSRQPRPAAAAAAASHHQPAESEPVARAQAKAHAAFEDPVEGDADADADADAQSSIALDIGLPPHIEQQVTQMILQQHHHSMQAVKIEMELKELWWKYAGRVLVAEGLDQVRDVLLNCENDNTGEDNIRVGGLY